MPRGGPRPGAGRPKGSKNKKKAKRKTRPSKRVKKKLPLEYMLRVMNDDSADEDRRDKMAYWAAPYCHPKADKKTGKKQDRADRAKKAGSGRFSAAAPPKLKAVK